MGFRAFSTGDATLKPKQALDRRAGLLDFGAVGENLQSYECNRGFPRNKD